MTTQVAHSTIEHLRQVLPGQSLDWYIRLGQQIHDGKIPMPSLEEQAPSVKKVGTSDQRLKNLLALCDDSKPKLNAVIEFSCRKHPGKPMAWHLDQIEAMLRPPAKVVTSQPSKSPVIEDTKAREEENIMQEKVKLYSNFGFYS